MSSNLASRLASSPISSKLLSFLPLIFSVISLVTWTHVTWFILECTLLFFWRCIIDVAMHQHQHCCDVNTIVMSLNAAPWQPTDKFYSLWCCRSLWHWTHTLSVNRMLTAFFYTYKHAIKCHIYECKKIQNANNDISDPRYWQVSNWGHLRVCQVTWLPNTWSKMNVGQVTLRKIPSDLGFKIGDTTARRDEKHLIFYLVSHILEVWQ